MVVELSSTGSAIGKESKSAWFFCCDIILRSKVTWLNLGGRKSGSTTCWMLLWRRGPQFASRKVSCRANLTETGCVWRLCTRIEL
jgi:hypothetical protein